ncbi:MAG: aldose 1-epimerase family protein [Opitutae bacterium]|jgi:hypothetical protein|nr:aldose 1-epimerase family protein [Opitutae bacterium]
MKKTALSILSCLLVLGSCSENKTPVEPETENALHRHGEVEYLESSTGHKDKTFATEWSVTQTVLKGGKQEGVELLTLDNGKLKITVIPTRGMGILDIRMGDVRLGWDSPVKEVVHPSHVDLESRGGLGWLEGFNEWMVRCGLEFAGHPGTDEFIDNTGGTATLNLTLHGKIQNIPASDYQITVDPDPPHRIRISGTVYEKFFYGPKLKLVTEISTIPGSDTFQISDKLTNEGSFPQEFQLIYHGNYGSSILEEGAMVYAPAKSVTPMNEHAAKAIDKWQTYKGPTPGFIEEVYLLEPLSDANSSCLALLTNAAGDQATSVRWNVTELPYLTVWKNTAAKEDGYVTGIEPATGYPFNRKVERKYGRVPRLDTGETRTFTLNFGIHLGRESVDEMVAEATQMQTSAKITINSEPPVTE